MVRPVEVGGCAVDSLWNDDFHHAAMVALTGRRDAYWGDYRGSAQEFISAAKWGFLYQGQWGSWRGLRRGGAAMDLQPEHFVTFLQNHDQIANTMWGKRVHEVTSPGRLRAMTAWLLLGPSTPMLFQGQEFASTSPFLYFADHGPELAKAIKAGRLEFRKNFPSVMAEDELFPMADPGAEETFNSCALRWDECSKHEAVLRLHRDLIALRLSQRQIVHAARGTYDGAVLSASAFLIRYLGAEQDCLLLVNLGGELNYDPISEPLLAPPDRAEWRLLWSSEDKAYQGCGIVPEVVLSECLRLPAESASFLVAERINA
jgi:maltooligosyltrehalose trehalohydrolase